MGAAAGLYPRAFGHRAPSRKPIKTRRLLQIGFHLSSAWLRALMTPQRIDRERRLLAIRRWARGIVRSLDIEVVTAGAPAPRGLPLLLVANHVSWLDICVLCSIEGALFVAKDDLAGWPIIGRITRAFGHFLHRRGSLRDAARVKDRVAAALRTNWPVAVFPEGTTGDGRALMPFYPAMIQAAVDARAMVQPVAIRYLDCDGALSSAAPFVGDQTFADSLGRILREPLITAELTFGPAFSAAGRSRRELASICHRFIARSLGLPECSLRADPRRLRAGGAEIPLSRWARQPGFAPRESSSPIRG
ncbi:MAG TPA: lysophospholipid acyltransferase family protein [Candidatus Binataceae bacterium]|nr:lysophospholipid acyltransferase family protein [Candidatus Binataceae bacterium]